MIPNTHQNKLFHAKSRYLKNQLQNQYYVTKSGHQVCLTGSASSREPVSSLLLAHLDSILYWKSIGHTKHVNFRPDTRFSYIYVAGILPVASKLQLVINELLGECDSLVGRSKNK